MPISDVLAASAFAAPYTAGSGLTPVYAPRLAMGKALENSGLPGNLDCHMPGVGDTCVFAHPAGVLQLACDAIAT